MNAQVYSYQRFSSPLQEKGTSLKRQTDYAIEVADRHGLRLNKDLVMTDKGLSAFHAEHVAKGALGIFIKAVEKGIVKAGSILIVESLDRLSRQTPWQAQTQFNELIGKGITIITANDDQVYNMKTLSKDPSKMFISIGVMMRAHEESLSKQKRSVKYIHKKIDDFEKNGKGDIAGSVPFWITRTKSGFELNKSSNTVKKIIEMYLNNTGLNLIARDLTLSKVKTPTEKNNSWGVTTIRKILDSKALYGCNSFKLSYLIDGSKISENHELKNYYPPIISEEYYNLIQERKKKKASSRESYKNSVYLLTSYGKGRSICAVCGQALGSQLQKQMNRKKEYTKSVLRLHCTKNKETSDCCSSVKSDELELHFIHAVMTNVENQLFESPRDNKDSIEAVQATIDKQEEKISALMSEFGESNISSIRKIAQKQIIEASKILEIKEKELENLKRKNSHEKIDEEQQKKIQSLAMKAQDFKNTNERSKLKQILMQSIKRIRIDLKTLELEAIFFNGRVLSILRKDGKFISNVYINDKNDNNIYRKLNNIE
ncbi:recombinase family protein [Marinomonas rhizomae]|uniref:Resolvase-like protein n=1 Tax=Marinomonas rhizomae TaxID=491948 RepID=A0A366JBC0_9GAMM|nr:recombinase family protein [Marinomonas rhizomae]RBP84253.1 resolvase-like protein [Marinomonas rhizomae]RNF74575.1 recombinase family protein [Marinomonas rhizomae]